MTNLARLSAAGFLATAVAFGPGRMGFGLFLSDFRQEFDLSSTLAGLVSGLGFAGFFLGLLAGGWLTTSFSPRGSVVAGLVSATMGMTLVAISPSIAIFAAGIFLAMASAGFAWTPFNDAAKQALPSDARPLALSVVSTGTSLGVALAALLALILGLSGISWRVAWWSFAAVAGAAALLNLWTLGNLADRPGAVGAECRRVIRRAAWPLHAIAFSFGATTAIYISFAGDRIAEAGGFPGVPPNASSAVVFLSYGIFGLTGICAGWVHDRTGLTNLVRGLLACAALSHLLIAVLPGNWPAGIASAALQGVFVMMASAIFALWAERKFPALPSFGFTAVLIAMAAGSVAGPTLAGVASDTFGAGAMFLGAATLALATTAVTAMDGLDERPA